MRFPLLSATLAVLMCTPNVVWGQGHTISDCSRAAQSEINTAYAFITQNLEAILTKSGLRDKKKTKIRNQWPSVKIVCVDQKPTCKTQGNLGQAHGILSNRVSICYDNHVEKGEEAYCELVDTLFHEAGHALNIPYGKLFTAHKRWDRIYNMGKAAGDVCKEQEKDRAIQARALVASGGACGYEGECASARCKCGKCYDYRAKEHGQSCKHNDECKTKHCNIAVACVGSGTCVCKGDSDCGTGKWCDRGVDFKNNACKRKFNKGEVCGTAGEVGVGHRCKSGKCKVSGISTKLKCK